MPSSSVALAAELGPKFVTWVSVRLVTAAAGAGLYFPLAAVADVHQRDQIAPAMFALAGVAGVVAGFAGTAVVFVAGAGGKAMRRVRREHGGKLDNALLSAMLILFITAVGLAACGLFSTGWGSHLAACALLTLPVADFVVVSLALKLALRSSREA